MIDEGAVLQALSKTEIAELCKIFGVDKSVRKYRDRVAALADHPDCSVEALVRDLPKAKLKTIFDAAKLPIRGKTRREMLARLIGTEHELGDLGAPYQTWIERMERFVQTVRP
ncbi:MAG: hypothetical protein AAGE52_42100, partial [Myxococcota bacterium]